MKRMLKTLGVLGVLLCSPAMAASQTQCVSNALAGGTVDAITIPLQPCGLATNILLLTLSGANTVTNPTLQMAGFPAQTIYNSQGGALAVGSLPAAGAIVQLTSTGTSWRLLTNGVNVATPLSVPNGGTGDTTLTQNGVLYGNGTSAIGVTAAGTTGQVLVGTTGSAPSWGAISSSAVTTLSFGTTGLTPNSATSGAITVAGTLGVANGGTGATTLTGIVKGAGTSPFSAATAGTDYVAPGTATTFTAKQTFNGSTSVLAAALKNATEPATISATAATGTINFDLTTQSILYYTTDASANWTVNFRGNGSTSLDSLLATGDVVTVVFEVTQGATAYYNSAVTVDGNAVTPKWQGGTAPTAGHVSSIDVYSYAIQKTGAATFVILASLTQFK